MKPARLLLVRVPITVWIASRPGGKRNDCGRSGTYRGFDLGRYGCPRRGCCRGHGFGRGPNPGHGKWVEQRLADRLMQPHLQPEPVESNRVRSKPWVRLTSGVFDAHDSHESHVHPKVLVRPVRIPDQARTCGNDPLWARQNCGRLGSGMTWESCCFAIVAKSATWNWCPGGAFCDRTLGATLRRARRVPRQACERCLPPSGRR
jgi:hypothetical protein